MNMIDADEQYEEKRAEHSQEVKQALINLSGSYKYVRSKEEKSVDDSIEDCLPPEIEAEMFKPEHNETDQQRM